MITRREAIKTVVAATTVVALAPQALAADEKPQSLFTLPPLPYPPDALEPFIDAQTMQIHHDKHHAAYINNLNNALAQTPELASSLKAKGASEETLASLLQDLGSVPEKVRTTVQNNAGGHYNHSLFWQMMRKGGGGEPQGDLAKALQEQFGSFSAFKEQLTKAAVGQFGSGWAWLSLDGKKLKLESSPNQDVPVSAGRPVLLGVDVWEHAYYLKYQNKRPDYVAAWFNVINWDFVNERYAKLKA
jgi:Fe-Mn family superoxide dismutase